MTFFGGIEPAPAVAFARATNDAMAALVERCPGRLLGSAQLPMQDPAAAVAELDRAVGDLGLVAAYIGTDYGMTLDDRRFDDFYRRLVELDVPVFVHGVTNDGRGPVGRCTTPSVRARPHRRVHLRRDVGGCITRPGRRPRSASELDVCLSHGGGAIAFLAQRFDSMARFRGGDSEFAASLRRLWFDSHLEPGPARDLVVDTVGLDRMVYGTNFGGWDTPTSTDDFDASLTPNAHRLLRLEATA